MPAVPALPAGQSLSRVWAGAVSVATLEVCHGLGELGWGSIKILEWGVPVMAQWLRNSTRNLEVAGLVPSLAQWVKDPALP